MPPAQLEASVTRQRLLPTETPLYRQHPRFNTSNGWVVFESRPRMRTEHRGVPHRYRSWAVTVRHEQAQLRYHVPLPRFIMECKLKRVLEVYEWVKCLDGNRENHDPSNYRVRKRKLRRHATETT